MIAGQDQTNYLGQSGEVVEVRIQRLGEGDDIQIDVKDLYELGWTIDGGGYCFAPHLEVVRYGKKDLVEEIGAASDGPSFTEGRVGFENLVFELVIVYDVVEDLLGESRRHDASRSLKPSGRDAQAKLHTAILAY